MKHLRKPPTSRETTFHIDPRKALGQHFLVDKGVIEAIARAAIDRAGPEKNVVEIGPGEGALTQILLGAGCRVTAIEKDPRAVEGLRAALQPRHPEHLEVVATDVLRWEPEVTRKSYCVGNLPYYITSDILLWLCRNQTAFHGAVVMIQKEVADRLVSPHGTKDYGRLTVRMQTFFEIEYLLTVPAAAFAPPPKVDSAVVALRPKGFTFQNEREERFFESFTTTLFSARRKMLRRALASTLDALERHSPGSTEAFWEQAANVGVIPEIRPDAIPPQAILALMRLLQQMHK